MSSQRTFGCATNTGHPLSTWLAECVLRTWVLLHVYLRCLSRGTCRPAPRTPDAHKQLVAEEQVSKFNSLQILTTNCLPSALLVEMSVAELTLFPASASRAALHDRTMSIARLRCCCRCPANSSAALVYDFHLARLFNLLKCPPAMLIHWVRIFSESSRRVRDETKVARIATPYGI